MSGELRRLFVAGVLLIPCGSALAQASDAPPRAGPLHTRQHGRAAAHAPAPHRSGQPARLDLSPVKAARTNVFKAPQVRAAARSTEPAGGMGEPKKEHGIYTWCIFGFTEGSDTDVPGGKSLYNQSDGRLGRANAGYWGLESDFGVSYSPDARTNLFVDGDFGDEAVLNDWRGALVDGGSLPSAGVSGGIKYQMLDRQNFGFGVAFQAQPYYARNALPASQAFGTEFRILADTEFIRQTLFGAVNFAYKPEASTGGSGATSTLEASAAIAGRVPGGLFLGAETRYLDKYSSLFVDQHLGWALYAGPTLYAAVGEAGYFGVAWSVQLAGRATATPYASLDLSDFERNQIRIKAGLYF